MPDAASSPLTWNGCALASGTCASRSMMDGLRVLCAFGVVVANLGPSVAARSPDTETRLVGSIFPHTVNAGETLGAIGSRFGVEPGTLARLNELRPNAVIKAGQQILVDNMHIIPSKDNVQVIVNVPQRMDSDQPRRFKRLVRRAPGSPPHG